MALTVAGCRDEPMLASRSPTQPIAGFLTGPAAAALQPDGSIALPSPPPGVLSASRATAIAQAYLERFGVLHLAYFREQSATRFEIGDLHPCRRPLLTTSVYEDNPDADEYSRRRMGPHWLIGFCLPGGRQVLLVSEAALAPDLPLPGGRFPDTTAALWDLIPMPLPPSLTQLPEPPENAIAQVATEADRRITEVPLLVQPPRGFAVTMARWRLALSDRTRVVGSVSRSESDESLLFVGWELRAGPALVLRARPSRQSVDTIVSRVNGRPVSFAFRRRPDLAAEFEAVSARPTGRVP